MATNMTRNCLALALLALLAAGSAQAEEVGGALGLQVAPFELPAVGGATWSLNDVADAKLVVVAFIGTECPLVRHYAPRLEALAQAYASRGARFVAIDSNAQDSADDIAALVREFELTFPVLRDDGARVADALGATRTPEVLLLDAERRVRYRGRIDDQGRVGFVRLDVDRHDLKEAMEELLAGKEVSQPELAPIGCLIGRRREPAKAPTVTYAKEVSRIFQRRCIECHRTGELGPFSMESYDEVAGWADMIREVVEQERMPPWFANPEHGQFSNVARLTAEEKEQIFVWVDAGAPLGDPSDLPEPRQFVDGWNIGEPDQVVAMADKPYQVPAEGTINYQHFVVDPGWKEDKWLVKAEVRPGNRTVVHHVFVLCYPPGERNSFMIAFDGGLIGAYAPGIRPFETPPGAARRIPAGSKVVFQMHYTTNGRAQEDLTKVGFTFCDGSEVKQEYLAKGASYWLFAIPPGAPNHEVRATHKFEQDEILVNLLPHMHLRGKSYRYVARYPDGRREILLDVPRYDFNWQIQYELAEPKLMPKGTVLECTAHYDNSAANPANPNPKALVTPGEQTWHEMMIGWYSTLTPVEGK